MTDRKIVKCNNIRNEGYIGSVVENICIGELCEVESEIGSRYRLIHKVGVFDKNLFVSASESEKKIYLSVCRNFDRLIDEFKSPPSYSGTTIKPKLPVFRNPIIIDHSPKISVEKKTSLSYEYQRYNFDRAGKQL